MGQVLAFIPKAAEIVLSEVVQFLLMYKVMAHPIGSRNQGKIACLGYDDGQPKKTKACYHHDQNPFGIPKRFWLWWQRPSSTVRMFTSLPKDIIFRSTVRSSLCSKKQIGTQTTANLFNFVLWNSLASNNSYSCRWWNHRRRQRQRGAHFGCS